MGLPILTRNSPITKAPCDTNVVYPEYFEEPWFTSITTPTGYDLNGRGIGGQFRATARFFLSSANPRLALRPNKPSVQQATGTVSPGLSRPGREADYSPPSTPEVKNAWIYTCSLP
jgi:hypothetical protein